MRAGDPEDAREEIRVHRALVVVERAEEQWQEASVLVAQRRRDRVRVVGERRLVAMEAGRIRGRDPELERDDCDDRPDAGKNGGTPSRSCPQRCTSAGRPTSERVRASAWIIFSGDLRVFERCYGDLCQLTQTPTANDASVVLEANRPDLI